MKRQYLQIVLYYTYMDHQTYFISASASSASASAQQEFGPKPKTLFYQSGWRLVAVTSILAQYPYLFQHHLSFMSQTQTQTQYTLF
ncbi:hypothetical protein QVD17_03799 [Tagetes erecta]|uniref:Uncharacterized protein n=1 Tax=Tagetes erecta TaxID=13708 RepID=A0AAD8LBK7_TARER|nr:hypothetical protein QVD17_03799 [Tagetes erecta]